MPWYDDAQVQQAQEVVRELARERQALAARVDALEAKPVLDNFQADTARGRAIARDKGYGPAEIDRLENFMAERGILHHQDAIRVDPVPPDTRFWKLGGLPQDEFDALMKGDDAGFLNTSIRRALNGE
jgi:hypothetical protein